MAARSDEEVLAELGVSWLRMGSALLVLCADRRARVSLALSRRGLAQRVMEQTS
jgi:hypothetical protein